MSSYQDNLPTPAIAPADWVRKPLQDLQRAHPEITLLEDCGHAQFWGGDDVWFVTREGVVMSVFPQDWTGLEESHAQAWNYYLNQARNAPVEQ